MELSVIPKEELEELVKTSVEKSLNQFYSKKREKEKLNQNLSVRDTAKYLNVSELTVRNYIKRGLIKADRIGNRILINRKRLDATLKEVKSLKYKRS
ncbi:MAG: helix-turn-helix domain-containing protein [Flavobacteriales bacterium]|nr:helix-turn-helix domain-containing protein [Flavobacteriales bacterium]